MLKTIRVLSTVFFFDNFLGYRTKRVDENRSTAREIKTVGRFNLFQNNFEGGQNVLIKML